MVELVDTPVLEAGTARCASSSLAWGTNSMKNIFLNFPEFIDKDPMSVWPSSPFGAYTTGAEFQYVKNSTAIPADLLAGASVLDLGCCTGATGAWVLSNGANRYVGVELQQTLAEVATENLTLRFPNNNWKIYQQSFTDFFANNTEQFDIVVLFGVICHGLNLETFIKNVVKLNPNYIVIDSVNPFGLSKIIDRLKKVEENTQAIKHLKDLPIIELSTNQIMIAETFGHKFDIASASANSLAMRLLLWAESYELVSDVTEILHDTFPTNYVNRYCLRFAKTDAPPEVPDFELAYKTNNPTAFSKTPVPTVVFESLPSNTVSTKISNYDTVITQTIQIFDRLFEKPDSRIIDIGFGQGELIRKLFGAGFHNLVGVESDSKLITQVKDLPIAHWINSDKFPLKDGPYSAVCCNYTLSLIEDNLAYLKDIYAGLLAGGALILTDRTYVNQFESEMHDNIKINPPEWYLTTLKEIGFVNVQIINAEFCFTTFLAIKP